MINQLTEKMTSALIDHKHICQLQPECNKVS